MAAFGFGLRREASREEQDAPRSEGEGAAERPGEDAAPAEPQPEVPERVARFRDLDEEIRRRGGELRSSKEAERASPATIGQRDPSARTKSAASESSVGERNGPTAEDMRKDFFKLAGRVEALESSVRETQQRNWEALHEQQDLVSERLGALEKRVEEATGEATDAKAHAGVRHETLAARLDAVEKLSERVEALDAQGPLKKRLAGIEKRTDEASAEAAEAEARADARLGKLAGRIEALEALPEQVEALDKRLGGVRDESRRSVEEARSAQRPLEQRLAGLEQAISGTVDQRLPGLEKRADEALARATEAEGQAGARLEKLAARVDALEREAASASRELEQRAAETIESLADRTELAEVIGNLSTRVGALVHRLNEAEKQSARTQERLEKSGAELSQGVLHVNAGDAS